ncbi:hypothetical protein HK097_007284 [Rhizophlyctis rosea]|uniref:Uncharacterized protein n=1 Tax=Rhizophlyctis rosea TaxID=64517 RepID=A0AAD5SDP9_9FUNG|nr:hypothetical protein HK097_007284 [Rhizophlyctis rosea]
MNHGHSHHKCLCGGDAAKLLAVAASGGGGGGCGGALSVKRKVEATFENGLTLVFAPENNNADAARARFEANPVVKITVQKKGKPMKGAAKGGNAGEPKAAVAGANLVTEEVEVKFVDMTVVEEPVDVDLEKLMGM